MTEQFIYIFVRDLGSDLQDRFQILFLMLREFTGTNPLLLSLKSSENVWFSDDFMGNRSELTHLNSLNIRSQSWKQSLTQSGNISSNLISKS